MNMHFASRECMAFSHAPRLAACRARQFYRLPGSRRLRKWGRLCDTRSREGGLGTDWPTPSRRTSLTRVRARVFGDAMSVTLRDRLLILTDRLLAVLVATLVMGATLAFGGGVWWARPVLAFSSFSWDRAGLARAGLAGAWRITKSPLPLVGLLGLFLGLSSSRPCPTPLRVDFASLAGRSHAGRVSRSSRRGLARADRARGCIVARQRRSIGHAALDRRGVGMSGSVLCVGQFTDRLRHLFVWSGVASSPHFSSPPRSAWCNCSARQADSMASCTRASAGPIAPSFDDLLNTPNTTVLRLVSLSAGAATQPGLAVRATGASVLRRQLDGRSRGLPGAGARSGCLWRSR